MSVVHWAQKMNISGWQIEPPLKDDKFASYRASKAKIAYFGLKQAKQAFYLMLGLLDLPNDDIKETIDLLTLNE